MKYHRMKLDSFQREFILEALEERIVLDAAVDPVDAVDSTDADVGLDPGDAEWTWEHGAWCYRDGSAEWWWWPDADSAQGGNWLNHTVESTGWWNYDWSDGWEWFYDAFYNDRYYYDDGVIVFGGGGLYWGQDGHHNWYFTADPAGNMDFSTWVAAVGSSNTDFSPFGDTGECYSPGMGTWVAYGSIEWTNDAPGTDGIPDPTAQDEDFGTYLYDISSYFTDTGGGDLSYYIVNEIFSGGLQLDGLSIDHDTGIITFNSHADSNGSVELILQAYDGVLFSGYETFTFTVNPVNDQPMAEAQTVTVGEDTVIAITLIGDDGDPQSDQTLTYFLDSLPGNGDLYTSQSDAETGTNPITSSGAISGDTVWFVSDMNDYTDTSFTFHVEDDGGRDNGGVDTSDPATVDITVDNVVQPSWLMQMGGSAGNNFQVPEDPPDGTWLTIGEITVTGENLNTESGDPVSLRVFWDGIVEYHGRIPPPGLFYIRLLIDDVEYSTKEVRLDSAIYTTTYVYWINDLLMLAPFAQHDLSHDSHTFTVQVGNADSRFLNIYSSDGNVDCFIEFNI